MNEGTKLFEKVQEFYINGGYEFEVKKAEYNDLEVAIMDCNESLYQNEYEGYVEKVAENIDGTILLRYIEE